MDIFTNTLYTIIDGVIVYKNNNSNVNRNIFCIYGFDILSYILKNETYERLNVMQIKIKQLFN